MITVACVYWQGKFRNRGRIYGTQYVQRLKNMVDKNLSVPHRFVCLSNVNVPCKRIPLIHNWPGWWSKIELYRPGLFKDRVLYIDLDELILRDLEPFFAFPSQFAIIGKKTYKSRFDKGFIRIKKYGSAVMVFDPEAGRKVYTEFDERAMEVFRGDQDYLAWKMPDLEVFPSNWFGRLERGRDGKLDDSVIIAHCMFPGKNQETAEKYEWVKNIWQ